MKKIKVTALFVMLILAFSANAQVKYQLVQSKSTLKVEGTSNVHDWEMDASDLTCSMLAINNVNEDFKITEVSFSCPAEKILSDNSIMDSKTHNALKTGDFTNISFSMKSIESFNSSGNNFSGEIVGVLTIAGVSKTVKFKFSGNQEYNKSIYVSGTVPIEMSDFNVEPPTAMFGALKTGNDIQINYKFYFEKMNQ